MLRFDTDGPYLTRGNRDMIPPKLYTYKSRTQVAGAYRSCIKKVLVYLVRFFFIVVLGLGEVNKHAKKS